MQKKIGMITLLWVIAVALLGLVTNPVSAQESTPSAPEGTQEWLSVPFPQGTSHWTTQNWLVGSVTSEGQPHLGIDLATNCGTNVLALADGTVMKMNRAAWDYDPNGWGNALWIDVSLSEGGVGYHYAHLQDILVQPGERVQQGQVVATVGETGFADGCHLHVGVFNTNPNNMQTWHQRGDTGPGGWVDPNLYLGNNIVPRGPQTNGENPEISIPFNLDLKRLRWELLIPIAVALAIAALLFKVGLLKLRWLFWIIGFVLILLAFAIPEALNAIGQSGTGRIAQFLSELAQGKPDMYLGVDWNRAANASLALGVASLALAWFFPSLSDLKKLLRRGKQELPYPWDNRTAVFNSLKLAVFGALWLSAWSVDSPFGKFLLSVPLAVTLLYVVFRLPVARRWNRHGELLMGKNPAMFVWGILEMTSAIWLAFGLVSFIANPALVYAKREPVIPTVWNVRWPQVLPKLVKLERTGGTYTSQLPELDITYWNGAPVRFSVPAQVWEPVLAAAEKFGCDPLLVIAVAHSESSQFNNTAVSPVGAAGVWQFMPGTWESVWRGTGELPDRTDIPRAAEAACRHIQNDLGFADETSHDAFVAAFTGADGSWTWNQHAPQADYVWRLWQELKTQTATVQTFGVSDYTIEFEPVEVDFQKFLSSLNLALGERMLISENASEVVLPYAEGTFVVTQGEHGASYAHAAVDLAGGAGTEVVAPINGVVTAIETDKWGSTWVVIENDQHRAELLHGDWSVQVGDVVSIGDPIGTEGNNGNTWTKVNDVDVFCGTGSGCGYHTHFNLVDKSTGKSVYPMDVIGAGE